MGFFGLLFWIAIFVLLTRACGWRRRWHRYDHVGDRRRHEQRESVIDALETRVYDLEERLDFTERLLQSRANPASGT
jgi:hypothetical protein